MGRSGFSFGLWPVDFSPSHYFIRRTFENLKSLGFFSWSLLVSLLSGAIVPEFLFLEDV
jgi:hypothetical protein